MQIIKFFNLRNPVSAVAALVTSRFPIHPYLFQMTRKRRIVKPLVVLSEQLFFAKHIFSQLQNGS
jgi:hypothetical protein